MFRATGLRKKIQFHSIFKHIGVRSGCNREQLKQHHHEQQSSTRYQREKRFLRWISCKLEYFHAFCTHHACVVHSVYVYMRERCVSVSEMDRVKVLCYTRNTMNELITVERKIYDEVEWKYYIKAENRVVMQTFARVCWIGAIALVKFLFKWIRLLKFIDENIVSTNSIQNSGR